MLLLRNLGHSARTVVFVWMVILLAFAGSGSFGKPKLEQETAPVSYFQQIRPILQQKCHGCHQPAVKQGDLLLTSYGDFKAGGRKGPAFLSSKPEQSNVLLHLKGELKPQMPLGGDPLGAEQIELFRRWIAEGAQDDTPEAARETLTPGELPVYHAPPVITALAYSPDGEVLAVSGYREVLLHKADGSGLKARLPGMSDRIQSLVYSSDGKILAAVGGTPARFGEVQFWDAREGKLGHAVRVGYDTLFGAAFSPDGRRLSFGLTDKTARVIEVETGKELLKIEHHDDWVFGSVFSLDGKKLVTVSRDRAAKLTEVSTGSFIENINALKGQLACIARHPQKDIVLIGGEDRVPYLYRMDRPRAIRVGEDATLIRSFEIQPGPIIALAFSPDGERIAVGGAGAEVQVYNTETGERVATITGHEAGIYAVAFHPNGQRLAVAGFDGWVRLYELDSGKLLKAFVPIPLDKPLVAAKDSEGKS